MTMLSVLAVGALTAGCADDGQDGSSRPTGASAATTAPTPSASPGSSPSSPSSPATVTIPASAFIEVPAKGQQAERSPMEVTEALPTLCGNEFGTGGKLTTASASMRYEYRQADAPEGSTPDGVLAQTIFTFEGAGATDYLRRLRTSLEACPSFSRGGSTVKVTTERLAGVGADALLVVQTFPERDLPGNLTGGTTSTQTAVVRSDEVITVLDNEGWEGTSSSRASTEGFARDAVRAIEAWQR
jgi:hypothetical protein